MRVSRASDECAGFIVIDANDGDCATVGNASNKQTSAWRNTDIIRPPGGIGHQAHQVCSRHGGHLKIAEEDSEQRVPDPSVSSRYPKAERCGPARCKCRLCAMPSDHKLERRAVETLA